MYNDVPTTCFGRFITGHHQVGITIITAYITAGVRTSPRITRRGNIALCLTYYQFVDVVSRYAFCIASGVLVV